ncbi:MAG TPA: CAP domain-containing protein [Terracidiphilus sp.]|nr:CAP domain-containing protein [Terracidiphilus sp.]
MCVLAVLVGAAAHAQGYGQQNVGQVMPGAAEQLMALANQSRAEAGLGRLQWDESLATAARAHCLRMAAEGPIAHRYGGEDSLSDRAAKAGAHFDVIEENVAVGPNAPAIHQEWMQSPGHRANLLSPEVNRVGIAVVLARGVLYATADYARNVQKLTPAQVEARVAGLIRVCGVQVRGNPEPARAACALDHGLPTAQGGPQATFVMRWQDSNLGHLPDALTEKLASGQYHMAAVGSCPAQGVEGSFTAYRVAVLLY